LGAEVVAAACIIDRSAGKSHVGVPLIALADYEVPAYPADVCRRNWPPYRRSSPAAAISESNGSRE